MLFRRDPASERWLLPAYAVGLVYVTALFWHYRATEPVGGSRLRTSPSPTGRSAVSRSLLAVGLGLALSITVLLEGGFDYLLLILMLATVSILVWWRRSLRFSHLGAAAALVLLAFLGGFPGWRNGFLSTSLFSLLLGFSLPMFLAGGLLMERTGLGASQVYAGHYGRAGCSFLKGSALFLPLGLMNAVDGGWSSNLDWVTQSWMPFTLPLFSAISEEVWFRFFLLGLVFFLLCIVFAGRTRKAAVLALLASSLVFGLGHGEDPATLFSTTFLYGLPLGVICVQRDLEHAMGGHYMINLVSWLLAWIDHL